MAHEINNPIGYVHSNIGSLRNYLGDLMALLTAYEQLPSTANIDALRKKIDVEFLREDIPSLISESQEGITPCQEDCAGFEGFLSGGQQPGVADC